MSEDKALAMRENAELLEKALIVGDLSKLSSSERLLYYQRVCDSLGVNPYTKPFQYITLNNRLTLYATRDCTDQLRAKHKVNAAIVSRERIDDVYVVTARATTPDGRQDESIGAVNIGGLKGDALANALMKAETKSKRRVTLSIVGLGWLDETEIETIPNARVVPEEQLSAPAISEGPPKIYRQPSDPPDEKLWQRWQQLWLQAQQLGIEFQGVQPDVDRETLISRGKALAAAIQQWHENQAAEPVEAKQETMPV